MATGTTTRTSGGGKTKASSTNKKKLTKYNIFVRDFARQHKGTCIMKEAGKAWQIAKKAEGK